MKWWQWIMCFIIISSGIFFTIDGIKILTTKSKTYGNYEYISNENLEIFKAECPDIVFNDMKVDNGYYIWNKTFEHIDFNGIQNDYILLINDCLTYNEISSAGSMKSNFNIDFIGTDGNVIGSMSVGLIINFFASNTEIQLSLFKDEENLNNFYNYLTNYGFTIKIFKGV